MTKIWRTTDLKSDKVILIHDRTIYKGKLSNEVISELNTENIDLELIKNLFSIPYSYIKEIINQKDISHIKIFFGNDSEEELNIKNEKLKNEVFNYLKNDIKELKYSILTPSVYKYAKAQIFAILITTGIFVWAMYLAIQIANGHEYEIVGGGRPGITGIVLALANFGIFKLVIGYMVILGIAIFSLVRKLMTRTEMQVLKR